MTFHHCTRLGGIFDGISEWLERDPSWNHSWSRSWSPPSNAVPLWRHRDTAGGWQEAGGESVLLVDVILESSGKRQPRNAPQGGGKAITTTTTTNTIAVKLLQFLGQLKSTFLATITFRHQFEEREKGMTRGGGTFNWIAQCGRCVWKWIIKRLFELDRSQCGKVVKVSLLARNHTHAYAYSHTDTHTPRPIERHFGRLLALP